ncbi:hypothetical protein ACROYT_G014945 [Oculina patagonica]
MVENAEEKAASLYEEMRKNLEHTGKDLAVVGKKQQQRHLTQIKNKAQDALWFGKTYGLIPQSLMVEDRNGMVNEINLTQTDDAEKENTPVSERNSESQGSEQGHQGDSCKERKAQFYKNLPEEEKDKVKSILYIMDKFSVSIQAYHELSQQKPALPRSYLV